MDAVCDWARLVAATRSSGTGCWKRRGKRTTVHRGGATEPSLRPHGTTSGLWRNWPQPPRGRRIGLSVAVTGAAVVPTTPTGLAGSYRRPRTRNLRQAEFTCTQGSGSARRAGTASNPARTVRAKWNRAGEPTSRSRWFGGSSLRNCSTVTKSAAMAKRSLQIRVLTFSLCMSSMIATGNLPIKSTALALQSKLLS